MDALPLILTLRLDDDSHHFFNGVRTEHFPPERNYLEAHCTLFHHLPGSERSAVDAHLTRACAIQPAFSLYVNAPKFTGRGVAYPLEGPGLVSFHKELQQHWRDWLTPQDRQGLHPHVTVQNKVTPEVARALQEKLAAEFPAAGMDIKGVGLQLWEYKGGPWKLLSVYQLGVQ